MSAPLLAVEDLAVDIRTPRGTVHAVEGVSFSVDHGEAMGLVGESGCGKTMTLLSIIGLLPKGAEVTAGRILLEGQDLLTFDRRAMRDVRGTVLSMIFQEPMVALNPVMRVGTQISEGLIAHQGVSRALAHERALELMRLVGIPDEQRRAKVYPHELSGGMRQRVMIGLALACRPKLILCDEPTTALDVTVQDQVIKLLAQLCSDFGVSLVYVTHDLAVVAQLCQRLCVMYAGQIVETGTVAQLFRQPRHPYTLGLLRAVADHLVVRESLVSIPGSPPDLRAPPLGCRFAPRCFLVQPDCGEGLFPLMRLEGEHMSACRYPQRCADAAEADPMISDA